MKNKFFLWLFCALLIQVSVYLYLDRILFAPEMDFSQETISKESGSSASKNYSYNKDYYAQISEGSVKFYTKNQKLVQEVKLRDKEQITYFSWLPQRNLALIGLSYETRGGTTVTLKPVNPELDSHPANPKIAGLGKGAQIVDVTYSTQTNVIYMLVKSGKNASVFRTDANNNLEQMDLSTTHIGRIDNLHNDDILLYDNTDTGQIHWVSRHGSSKIISPENGKFALLGVDEHDNIYIGKLAETEKISEIYIQKSNGFFVLYKKLDYAYPVDAVKITADGNVILS
ncbi:hypothetical protein RDV78_03010 [Bacillota bacterium LX-D]|nr:hypothetical protein [Bacillota bacterium LX-D]